MPDSTTDIVTAWLDDDEALRIPDTEWGRELHAALTDLVVEVKNLRFGVAATSRLLAAYAPQEKP